MRPHKKTSVPELGSPSETLTSGYFRTGKRRPAESSAAPPLDGDVRGAESPVEIRVLAGDQAYSPAYEIWTRDAVYEFDQSLRCVAEQRLVSDGPKVRFQSVGAALIGGRITEGQTVNVSAPLPCVGHRALLGSDHQDLIVTAPVTRVVMNLRRWSFTRK